MKTRDVSRRGFFCSTKKLADRKYCICGREGEGKGMLRACTASYVKDFLFGGALWSSNDKLETEPQEE